jgi:hypothetical protein
MNHKVGNEQPRQVASVSIAVVTYEHHAIYAHEAGGSLGQVVDAHIVRALEEGKQITEVMMEFHGAHEMQTLRELYGL